MCCKFNLEVKRVVMTKYEPFIMCRKFVLLFSFLPMHADLIFLMVPIY